MQPQQITISANATLPVPDSHIGGEIYLQTSGSFGGGSLALQCTYNGTNWTTLVTQTAEGFSNFDLAPGAQLRYVLTGATTPSIVAILR